MELDNQKSVNNTFSSFPSLNTGNLDKIQNLMTNHQSYILKSYNDNNNLHQFKKPKSTSLHGEINDIKLLNDENYFTIQKSTNDHAKKIDTDEKENKLNKGGIYSSTNEANKCIKESRYFVDFLSKERCIRSEGSEEENCFNVPTIINKKKKKKKNMMMKNIVEYPKGLCQKDDDILMTLINDSNKNTLSKRDKNSSLSIEKEISQTGAESKSSSYLNQNTNTYDYIFQIFFF